MVCDPRAVDEPMPLLNSSTRPGIVHVHSDYSHDGHDSLEHLHAVCAKRGIGFVGLTDHAEDFAAFLADALHLPRGLADGLDDQGYRAPGAVEIGDGEGNALAVIMGNDNDELSRLRDWQARASGVNIARNASMHTYGGIASSS